MFIYTGIASIYSTIIREIVLSITKVSINNSICLSITLKAKWEGKGVERDRERESSEERKKWACIPSLRMF